MVMADLATFDRSRLQDKIDYYIRALRKKYKLTQCESMIHRQTVPQKLRVETLYITRREF